MFRWKLFTGVVLVAGVQVLNAEDLRSSAMNSSLGNSSTHGEGHFSSPPQVFVAPEAFSTAPQQIEPCPMMTNGTGGGEYGSPEYARGAFPAVRGFWFRRYAGSVEMPTKTLYPRTYSGSYYYNGWRPAWIRDVPYPRPALAVDRFWHEPGSELLYHPVDDQGDSHAGPKPQTGEPAMERSVTPPPPPPKVDDPFGARPSRQSTPIQFPTGLPQTMP